MKDIRFQMVMAEGDKAMLEALAVEDGVPLGAEVRNLVKREVSRRRSKRRGMFSGVCADCPKAVV
jgi:hypothetical protein